MKIRYYLAVSALAIAARSRHARQTDNASGGQRARQGRMGGERASGIARFLRELIQSAEPLTNEQRRRRILTHAVRSFLRGRQLRLTTRLMAPA